jgi:hypothetical protein
MNCFYGEKIYILGLERKDSPQWRSEFESVLPKEKIEFFIGKGIQNPKNDGTFDTSLRSIMNFEICDPVSIDIFQNHVKILQNAFEKNYSTIMVLEDDATFPNWNSEKWDRIQIDLQKYQGRWDMCYLGYCQWPFFFSTFFTRDLIHIKTPLTTHAYIISRTGIEKFLKFYNSMPDLDRKYHIDKALHKTPTMKMVGVFPMISFQKTCPALFVKALDKMNCRLLFSTFCRINEWVCVSLPFLCLLIFSFLLFYILKTRK